MRTTETGIRTLFVEQYQDAVTYVDKRGDRYGGKNGHDHKIAMQIQASRHNDGGSHKYRIALFMVDSIHMQSRATLLVS